ncbi:phage neck terminator protein [Paenibacillus polymyxa]|uniref:Phage neck terminator protein gp12-like domain-containing protein n=1 Tax=Paenibacillus polymyxa TaxID=1406 RepID=A0A378XTU5_PAEPO|nr:hypothetical protein [Paenibacillus polymyxa]MBE7897510.1 hypothetical protein [Paenibacillus polymyxa]MBG9766210.1 hypothetical protein [Paenibacillus polymyxa]MCC3257240.1 hypothetical protein [Paenibacillus polymyxa]UOD87842.1 hypothetical protein CUU60_22640 [Paenibacillus polymyxa ATCC 842]WEK64040.1 hypothetical protein ERJ71_06215 [Paenibacillus polymyxa]
MIPFKAIRSAIVRGLSARLGLEVIELNGGGDMPKGAFLTYNISDGFAEGRGFPVVTQENGKLVQRETVEFTVSFLSYAADSADSITNALRAQDWLKTIGRDVLKDLNVVVFNIGSVDNRDILIADEWERRYGFDVDFRTTAVADQDLEYIEKVKIANKIIT